MSFTFNFTKDQLRELLPNNQYLDYWYDTLTNILPEYGIDTPQRVAAWIAQCAHESAGFTALHENLNYKAESLNRVFHKYFPTMELANDYAKQPERIANRVYGNRMGNGPEESGDGYRYCGRGLIQLTGKDNYQSFADSLEMDIDAVPEYLETFEGAAASAAWFWEINNLNSYADKNDILGMTKKINGGTIGLADREQHYHHALQVFGVA